MGPPTPTEIPPDVESTEPSPIIEVNRPRSSSASSTGSVVYNPEPERRGRSRSTSLCGANPLEIPITPIELQLARLASSINARRERERAIEELRRQNNTANTAQFAGEVGQFLSAQAAQIERDQYHHPLHLESIRRDRIVAESGAYRGIELTGTAPGAIGAKHREDSTERSNNSPYARETSRPPSRNFSRPLSPQFEPAPASGPGRCSPAPQAQHLRINNPSPATPSTSNSWQPRPVTPGTPSLDVFSEGHILPIPEETRQRIREFQRCSAPKMNYQNYLDSPQAGPGSNPRQAPPSPSQNMNHANGMNGGMGMGGGMVGYPTPAGHQSDLNYVYAMVEELSAQLAINREFTDKITEHMGRIRAKAMNLNLTNDELIAAAAQELNESSKNLEKENSELRKALEKVEYDKKENWKLAVYGANILADILEKMHKFKEQHEHDTLAWHKNYRKQLADEREENLNLRCQINDMKAAACRANGHLRDMRRWVTDHDELNELKIQNIQFRQERRWWKRMAMPRVPDDDPMWSDDDDLIDPEEKKRQAAKAEKEKMEKEAGNEEDPNPSA